MSESKLSLAVLAACGIILIPCGLLLPASVFPFLCYPLLLYFNLESFLYNYGSFESSPLRIFVLILNATLVIISYFRLVLAPSQILVPAFPNLNAGTILRVSAIFLFAALIVLVIWLRRRYGENKLLLQQLENWIVNREKLAEKSKADELQKWKQLYDDGTISEEMFSQKKEELMKK